MIEICMAIIVCFCFASTVDMWSVGCIFAEMLSIDQYFLENTVSLYSYYTVTICVTLYCVIVLDTEEFLREIIVIVFLCCLVFVCIDNTVC